MMTIMIRKVRKRKKTELMIIMKKGRKRNAKKRKTEGHPQKRYTLR
jgi:hypothetical protein